MSSRKSMTASYSQPGDLDAKADSPRHIKHTDNDINPSRKLAALEVPAAEDLDTCDNAGAEQLRCFATGRARSQHAYMQSTPC